MFSQKYRFLFIHIPKTAGNSIHRALLPYSEDEMVCLASHHDGIDRFEVKSSVTDKKHMTYSEYLNRLGAEAMSGIFKFACVRNPWDRCVSYFFSPHRGDVKWSADSFERFIQTEVLPISDYVSAGSDDIEPYGNMDAYIRFEHLTSDYAEISCRIGFEGGVLPWANASKRDDYRSYYARPETVDLVASKFAQDIARFGYQFE